MPPSRDLRRERGIRAIGRFPVTNTPPPACGIEWRRRRRARPCTSQVVDHRDRAADADAAGGARERDVVDVLVAGRANRDGPTRGAGADARARADAGVGPVADAGDQHAGAHGDAAPGDRAGHAEHAEVAVGQDCDVAAGADRAADLGGGAERDAGAARQARRRGRAERVLYEGPVGLAARERAARRSCRSGCTCRRSCRSRSGSGCSSRAGRHSSPSHSGSCRARSRCWRRAPGSRGRQSSHRRLGCSSASCSTRPDPSSRSRSRMLMNPKARSSSCSSGPWRSCRRPTRRPPRAAVQGRSAFAVQSELLVLGGPLGPSFSPPPMWRC